MTISRSLFLLGIAAFALTACGEAREDLGLGRSPPDEFAVVEHPPLSIPPDFSLRPPRPGAPNPQMVDPSQRAREALFANGDEPDSNLSAGEKSLLAAAGASKAPPDIRETLDREASQKVVASPHLVERLTEWGDDQKPAATVDAAAEAARIKQAQDNNQPIASGPTPIIEKQESGWLGM